ncbi:MULTISPECIES: AMP-binding protein [unclassified Pseudonocardia]|uniref:AMP-binding protein n=1 Tax=unclassified Pseudonocardia TaxID=2619320 RepID=UPI000959FC91|nr:MULTISPECIES: AMP-binding protein [unclassified Pseudonocardia]MBN9099090.1 AMP-binding protein [Pseudonocardia sp.]OJY53067.1 MAG: AMP-dependent synthetase [Pseudonocardia sp. 73-21]
MNASAEAFYTAREFLMANREDYDRAYRDFRWPEIGEFNWALDHFDNVATQRGDQRALWIIEQDGSEAHWTYAELSERSNRVANWLRAQGVARGDRIILMLGNQFELWETILAAMKLGAVVIPATTLLTPADLRDRLDRGAAKHVVVGGADVGKFDEVEGDYTKIAVRDAPSGWLDYSDASAASAEFTPDGATFGSDTLLLYFTSGTTAKPKLVEHTHASYPVGHLSTMYWIGLEPGDVHLNISSPGWAKHAWSNVFTPWIAEACVLVMNYTKFDAAGVFAVLDRCNVTSFCAPPTVWRMLIQADLSVLKNPPQKVVGAGEPLNPEVIDKIDKAWGVRIRDGFGQTESTVQIGNPPGQIVKPGSMGRPIPGYPIVLVDPATGEKGVAEGEICVDLEARPLGLMVGYYGDAERNAEAMAGGVYHTGDVGSRDEDGYITYVGRADDVFKASDYRISPFELESVLIEHPAVAEAAIVPSPDPVRLAVPKAYVVLAAGYEPTEDTAREILQFARDNLAPYKRIRRLEFAPLPKTISGKIRRVELRGRENDLHGADTDTLVATPEGEFTL